MEFYIINNIYIGSYEIVATGKTPKEALNCAWKIYKEHFDMDFKSKARWLEYHGVCEKSCEKIKVGEGFIS